MTWAEFIKEMEDCGVLLTDEIDYIDISAVGTLKSLTVSRGDDMEGTIYIEVSN